MRKGALIAMVFFALVGVVFVLVRLTGMVQWYFVPTGSNLPTFKIGRHLFVSHCKQSKRLDFLAYKMASTLPGSDGRKEVYIHRLIGIPGDLLEIKDGQVYINGNKIDSSLNLNCEYIVSKDEMRKIEDAWDESDGEINVHCDNGVCQVMAPREMVLKNKIDALPLVRKDTDEYIQKQWGKGWNADRFGPVKIPADCYFVMGDNRHNSLDSRYTGFVKKSNIAGTVLGDH